MVFLISPSNVETPVQEPVNIPNEEVIDSNLTENDSATKPQSNEKKKNTTKKEPVKNTEENDSDNTAKAPEEEDYFTNLRAAISANFKSSIHLGMTEKELIKVLKKLDYSYKKDDMGLIVSYKNICQIDFVFIKRELAAITTMGTTGGGISNIKLGDTVADMKKVYGKKYDLDDVTHEYTGSYYFYYKLKNGITLCFTAKKKTDTGTITGIELYFKSYVSD